MPGYQINSSCRSARLSLTTKGLSQSWVMFNYHLNMDSQIQNPNPNICKSAYFHLRNIVAVHCHLPDFASVQLTHALIT